MKPESPADSSPAKQRAGMEAIDSSILLRFDPAILDPVPGHFATQLEGTGGKIKVRPEDFLVDEQPLYQPSGSGNHLYLFIEKRNVSHVELMAAVRKRFGVDNREIGFAGMKDKVGVTRQLVSVCLPNGHPLLAAQVPQVIDLQHDRIAVLWADRHTNKIKRGHLAGNRFSIRIREVDPLLAPRVLRTLRMLEKTGVPNYFGGQRFGYRRNNHLLGALFLSGQYKALLDELLGSRGTPFPKYQRERRELYEQGRFRDALEHWTPADASERSALRLLMRGRGFKRACYAVGKTTWEFWIAAMQSAVFNRVLDHRMENGALDQLVQGDLAWKHASRSVFAITRELADDPEIANRLQRFEISPSGPLWGRRLTRAAPGSETDQVEQEALGLTGFAPETLAATKEAPDGSRRPLREPVRNTDLDAGLDEHGPYIRVAFDLPRGAYATIVMREIMKSTSEDD